MQDKQRETITRWFGRAARAAAGKRGTFTIEEVTKDTLEQLDFENNPLLQEHLALRGLETMFELAKKRDPEKFREFEMAVMYGGTDRPEGSRENMRKLAKEIEELARQQEEIEAGDAG